MKLRLTKTWIDLRPIDHDTVPAQLGVFHLADASHQVVHIGYAGGREPFGLRSAVTAAVAATEAATSTPVCYVRYEVTHGYLSRWEELLMIHQHDTGRLPVGNTTLSGATTARHRVGRLTLDAATAQGAPATDGV